MTMETRKSIRLSGYDYSQQGAYFITVCTRNREPLFWVRSAPVGQGLCPCLSPEGIIVRDEIDALEARFPSVHIEKYVVMDDHIHILFHLTRQGQSPCPTIGAIIGALKSITTKRINGMRGTPGWKLWQFRYYDHVIRDDNDFLIKWNYIDTNPARWQEDEYCEG